MWLKWVVKSSSSSNMGLDVSIFSEICLISFILLTVSCHQDLPITRHVIFYDNWYFQLIQPNVISYTYKIRPAKDFGLLLNQTYVNIDLVPSEPYHACTPITNGLYIKNNIALVERGECSFVTKALHAEEVGATAIIITDQDSSNDSRFVDMIGDGTDRHVDIPSFYMLGKDGYMIKKTLDDISIQSATINIPINASGISPHLLNQPPWTLW